jgi:CHASE3 domain sensor protein
MMQAMGVTACSLYWVLGRACRPRNLIAQSQAGTGKTAAFALCMLGRTDASLQAVQALCIAPTRELARQIADVVTHMAKFTKVTVYQAVKDRDGPGPSAHSPYQQHQPCALAYLGMALVVGAALVGITQLRGRRDRCATTL